MKTRQYNNGDTCTISANPGSHYTFDGWYENDTLVSSSNPYSFTVSSDKTLEGKFTAKSYTITTATSPISGGSISGGGTYDYGDTCTLTATENAGYTFATWVDENNNFLSNSNPYTFTVSGDLTAKALFSSDYNTYTITVISNHGTVSGAGTYELNDTCTLTATPSSGYTFDHWEMNGVEISDDNPYSFTVNGDKTITAVYEVIPAALRITTNGTSSVYLRNANNQLYTWNLSAGLNEYYGTEPGFALNEITYLNPSNVLSYIISMDASELTSWTSVNNFSGSPYLESVILPDSITSMVMLAFSPCPNLESINFPSSLTTIGNAAFKDCTSLESVDLSDTLLTEVRFNVFSGCTSLTSIILPDTLTSIGQQAFYNCTSLTSINLPNTLTNIDSYAFRDCSSLTSITLPNSLTSIGYYAFNDCNALTSINIPANVSSIGEDAFGGCNNLTSITVDSNNTHYNDGNGNNCIIETATNKLIRGCDSTIIPNTVVALGDGAFSDCTGLTSIILPDSITRIGVDAFYNCSSLTNLTLPSSLTTIETYAFQSCRNLTSITLPSSLTTIGQQAFSGCTGLASITCLATTPPTIGTNAFFGTNNCPIYVPAASLSAYQSAWSEYASRLNAM